MKLLSVIIFASAIAIAAYVQPADAPDQVIVKRQAKLFYDRIVKEEPVREQKCKTYGTVWYRNACWRPERIQRVE